MNRILFLLLVFAVSSLEAQFDKVVIKVDTISQKMYMLTGRGGNIGIYLGQDRVFMIDDQYAPLGEKIQNTLSSLTDKPISYLFNTHMHGDHSGGNINFNGEETTLIAHDKVRDRLITNGTQQVEEGKMSSGDYKKLLPEITFADQMTFFEADEKVMAFHVHEAHTDGDTMIYFVTENVLHMGDTYFAGNYPFIDLNSGGSLDGYIAAHEKAQLVIDDKTVIIPGHGLLSNKKELKVYTNMLKDIRSIVQKEIDAGKTLEQVKADTDLLTKYDGEYGTWFINPERMRETAYRSLTAEE